MNQTPAAGKEKPDTDGGKQPEAGDQAGKRQITARDRKLAMAQFKSYCAGCHGATGKGDGPTGKWANPKPRNWTDKAWQKRVTDEHLYELIRDGGQKHGLSPLMQKNPLYGDAQAGVLWALVEIVRDFGK